MANLTLTFEFKINTSVQVGDIAYYAPLSTADGFTTNSSDIRKLGEITSISAYDTGTGEQTIVVNFLGYEFINGSWTPVTAPPNESYIFFSKDNAINVSSIRGYYSLAKFVNDSNTVGELFSASCGVSESSK